MFWIILLIAAAIIIPIVAAVWATWPSQKFWKEQNRIWRGRK
jgi:hypothetical protein